MEEAPAAIKPDTRALEASMLAQLKKVLDPAQLESMLKAYAAQGTPEQPPNTLLKLVAEITSGGKDLNPTITTLAKDHPIVNTIAEQAKNNPEQLFGPFNQDPKLQQTLNSLRPPRQQAAATANNWFN